MQKKVSLSSGLVYCPIKMTTNLKMSNRSSLNSRIQRNKPPKKRHLSQPRENKTKKHKVAIPSDGLMIL